MTIDRVRYGRQIRLREIGHAGQERLSTSAVVPKGQGPAREIEATYLRYAGVPVTEKDGLEVEVDVSTLGLSNHAAREVGEGALRALEAMRRILGLATP
jgi:hypothetical protein